MSSKLITFCLLASVKISLSSRIPAGFDYTLEAFGKTYYGTTTNVNFARAVTLCQSIGASVLKIRNQKEQTWLEGIGEGRHGVWLDAESTTRWRDGTDIRFSKFSNVRRAHLGCVWVAYGSKDWTFVACDQSSYVICEIDHNAMTTTLRSEITSTPLSTGVNFKELIVNHSANNLHREMVDERLGNIERRLEQMSNAVFNRVVHYPNDSQCNVTAEAIRDLQEKQTSMAESIEDIKQLVALMYKSLNSRNPL